MRRLIIGLFGLLAIVLPIKAQLVINEIMQSNIDCLMDDQNEFPDSWVELYNSGEADIDLSHYRIGITDKLEQSWRLPSVIIHPHEFGIVYCDKVSEGLHTDFRLESGKDGCVYLFEDKSLCDKIEDLKKQPAPNISYGRKEDGSTEWGYLLQATPGLTNCWIGVVDREQILKEPIFSLNGQVFNKVGGVNLELKKTDDSPEETYIVYTTDGSEPTKGNGIVYTAPIEISHTTIVKAKLLCDGWLSPRSTVNSYIFHDRDVTLPVISLSTDDRYVNDSKIGILVDGDYQEDMPNYRFNWRRPVQIEFFEKDSSPSVVNQLCEFRVAGASTRVLPLKTMNIYAHKRFGTKRLSYVFFPDQKPEINEFKSLVLRNSGSRSEFYSAYVRDALVQRTMGQNADLDYQAYRPAILYLNGQYRGVINIRERTDEDFVYSNYDGLEEVDVVENNAKLVSGTMDVFTAFKTFYEQREHTLKEYNEWMDWSEFMNLVVMNLYFCNIDFLGNNNIMWRAQSNGKWRWIAKDCGYSVGSSGKLLDYNYNIFRWLYENKAYDTNYWGANSEEATLLFRHLMEDKVFYKEFLDRICIYVGDFLNERGARAYLDSMYDLIKEELAYHKMLYMPDEATSHEKALVMVDEDFGNIKKWLHARTDIFFSQMGDYYHLGEAVPLTINPDGESASIIFNGICLRYPIYSGKFFKGMRISLSGDATESDAGIVITGWSIKRNDNSGTSHEDYVEGSTLEMDMPDCDSLVIKPYLSGSTAIVFQEKEKIDLEARGRTLVVKNIPANEELLVYTANGVCIGRSRGLKKNYTYTLPNAGMFLIKVGNKVRKVVTN